MKVSVNWVREWVNSEMNAGQLASLLTMAGLEVDAVTPVCGSFSGVVAARVLKTAPHPEADRLSLCEVDPGDGTVLKVVCGASNVRAGLKVALAKTGARLPGDLVIRETRLRGALSQGMLCSASELGLADHSEGIIELDEDAPVGVNLREYLMLEDEILDIDLTPNRADCLSIAGVARDISALTQTPYTPVKMTEIPPQTDEQKKIHLQAGYGCPYYCGRIIRNIHKGALTPLWMREKLRRSGIRCIHPVVDVTNYVMLELGQPMHAFDADTLSGDIIVRNSRENETLELLDGQSITIKDNSLLITDSEKILALAGVMGGAESSVTEQTDSIFLESAFFNPVAIAGVARSYGLSSESSRRFERGVDPDLPLKALERATELLLEITGGRPGPVSVAKDKNFLPEVKSIFFNPETVKKITGADIEHTRMLQMLKSLGMAVGQNEFSWQVIVPSYRFDISQEVDLVEEIIRVYGYDKIPGSTLILPVKSGRIQPEEILQEHCSKFLAARGYHETISYSFVDPQLQNILYPDAESPRLLNPLSPELSIMRAGLWSGLLASMLYNAHRQQTSLQLFEAGVVFIKNNKAFEEHACIGGLLSGDKAAFDWSQPTGKYDFFDAKGDLQALFASLNLASRASAGSPSYEFSSAAHPALHPGKSAALLIDKMHAGWCGVLHPGIAEALDIQEEVILFELRLAPIGTGHRQAYKKISRFPFIRRDLSLVSDETVCVSSIHDVIETTVPQNWLKSFDVFDVYSGAAIPKGKKSLAVSVVLQDDSRTLVDSEINQTIDAIIKRLDEELAITLRE